MAVRTDKKKERSSQQSEKLAATARTACSNHESTLQQSSEHLVATARIACINHQNNL
jgi:hypothetical protein